MRKTKANFIELCCQLFADEPEKSLAQINIERAMRGEEQFLIEPKHLKQFNITAWVFGFVSSHKNDGNLVNCFEYGLNHNWFYSKKDENLIGLFECAMEDLMLKDRDLYIILSDYYITHFPKAQNINRMVSVAYSLSMTHLDYDEIIELHRKYNLSNEKKNEI